MRDVSLAEARTHLNELVAQAEAGEPVRILRGGKPVARLAAVTQPRKPIDLAWLRALTAAMPETPAEPDSFVRRMRDEDRL